MTMSVVRKWKSGWSAMSYTLTSSSTPMTWRSSKKHRKSWGAALSYTSSMMCQRMLCVILPNMPSDFNPSKSICVLCCVIQTLLSCLLTHLHVVTGRVQLDPLDDTRSALMVPRLDHAVHSWILESLSWESTHSLKQTTATLLQSSECCSLKVNDLHTVGDGWPN